MLMLLRSLFGRKEVNDFLNEQAYWRYLEKLYDESENILRQMIAIHQQNIYDLESAQDFAKAGFLNLAWIKVLATKERDKTAYPLKSKHYVVTQEINRCRRWLELVE